jgi:hypothetical protein
LSGLLRGVYLEVDDPASEAAVGAALAAAVHARIAGILSVARVVSGTCFVAFELYPEVRLDPAAVRIRRHVLAPSSGLDPAARERAQQLLRLRNEEEVFAAVEAAVQVDQLPLCLLRQERRGYAEGEEDSRERIDAVRRVRLRLALEHVRDNYLDVRPVPGIDMLGEAAGRFRVDVVSFFHRAASTTEVVVSLDELTARASWPPARMSPPRARRHPGTRWRRSPRA